MILRDCLAVAAKRLAAAGIEAPMREARLLAAHALKVDPVALVTGRDDDPGAAARSAIEGLVARRAGREPLSRILGEREFWSLSFAIGPAVLDPRSDSETLIEALLRHRPDRHEPLRLLDLGTGSGCLLLTALSLYPKAWGLAVDLSGAALRVARDNARALGLTSRVGFCQGDWASALAGGWDLVLCNPPYIVGSEIDRLAPEVRCHDPREALDGGRDGLAAYGRLVPQVADRLAPGGLLLLELGMGQDRAVGTLLAEEGLILGEAARDLAGRVRCLVATRPDREKASPAGGWKKRVGTAANPL